MPLCTLSELTGDFVVYRNLEPYDARVPGVSAAWREMGLAGPQVVRKSDPLYPQAARWIDQLSYRRALPHLHADGRANRLAHRCRRAGR